MDRNRTIFIHIVLNVFKQKINSCNFQIIRKYTIGAESIREKGWYLRNKFSAVFETVCFVIRVNELVVSTGRMYMSLRKERK